MQPTQAAPTGLVRTALHQHVAISPASRSASNSVAPRAASASLGTASAPSFWCFRPARSYAPGHTYWNRIAATRGQVCWSCPLPVAPQLGRGADPSLNKQTCSLRATPARCTFASLELRNLLAPPRFSSRPPPATMVACGRVLTLVSLVFAPVLSFNSPFFVSPPPRHAVEVLSLIHI